MPHARHFIRKEAEAHVLNARFSPTALFGGPQEPAETTTQAGAATPAIANTATTQLAATTAPLVQATSTTLPAVQQTTSTCEFLFDFLCNGNGQGQGQATTSTSAAPPKTTSPTSTSATSSSTTSSSSTSSSTSTTTTSSTTSSSISSTVVQVSTPSTAHTTALITSSLGGTSSLPLSSTASGTLGSAAASSTSTDGDSGMSTGVMVGAVAGGLAGLAGVLFALLYFMRRNRNKEDYDEGGLDRSAMRRQSMALVDDEPRPRPPTMIQRHATTPRPPPPPMPNMYQNNYGMPPPPPHAYGNMPPPPPQAFGGYPYGHGSFNPGEFASPVASPAPTGSPYTAQPFFSPISYSPVASPVLVNPNDYQSEDPRHPSMGSVLSRQPSQSAQVIYRQNSMGPYGAYTAGPYQTGFEEDQQHYVNLDRSSVTPFQAQQYDEIHRRLGSVTPEALGDVIEEGAGGVSGMAMSAKAMEAMADADPRDREPPAPPYLETVGGPSTIFDAGVIPSPIATHAPPSRVPSVPPSLPAIDLVERGFSPVSSEFPLTIAPLPSPFEQEDTSKAEGKMPVQAPAPAAAPETKKEEVVRPPPSQSRPETVYDTEDAYGGI